MKNIKFVTSACKYCRYYNPEGRRGGNCQQLGAPVLGHWKACSLALPPFAPSWETLEDVWSLPERKLVVASGINHHKVVMKELPRTSASVQVQEALNNVEMSNAETVAV